MPNISQALVHQIAKRAVAEFAPEEAHRFDEVWAFYQSASPDLAQDRAEPHFFEHPLVVQLLSPAVVGIVVGLVPIVYDIVKSRRKEKSSRSREAIVREDRRVTEYSRRVSKRLQYVRLKIGRNELIERTLSIIVDEIESNEQAVDETNRMR